MSKLDEVTLAEAIKHPIATLLRIFNLQRIGTRPASPVADYAPTVQRDGKDADPFDRTTTALADILKRRGWLNRIEKYAVFEEMDRDPLVAEILNTYAEAATQINYHEGVVVWTEARNKEILQLNDDMLKRIGYHEMAFARVRDLVKFGDVFDGIVYQPNREGVVALKPYDPWKVARIADEYGRLMGFAPSDGSGEPTSIDDEAVPPYDISHIRLLSKDRRMAYGTSMLDGTWEKYEDLQAVEDSIVIQRLLRRPDRLMLLLDTTGLSLPQSFEAVKRYEKFLYKEIHVKRGHQFQSRGTVMSDNRDLIFPKGPNNATEITNFPASSNNDLLRDWEMLIGRFLGAFGLPKGYFGMEGGGEFTAGSSLGKQNVPFAKKAMRVQFAFLTGTVHIGMINQALRGLDPFRRENRFEVHGMPISSYMEIEYNELLQMRFDLVERMSRTADDLGFDKPKWIRYVLTEVAKFPDDLIDNLMVRIEPTAQAGEEADMTFEADDGKDRETLAALKENEGKIERALIFDEAMRSSVATSGDTAAFMHGEKVNSLVERHKQTDAKLLESMVEAEAWEETIFAETAGAVEMARLQEEKLKDRIDRLQALIKGFR